MKQLWLWLCVVSGGAAQTTENDQYVMAILFQQKAAEYRALCYQAYALARWQFEQDLKISSDRPRAVVLDIDETVLDNSPYAARQILDGASYPSGWDAWVEEARAIAVPGALDFLQWVDSNRIAIFYVSNRADKLKDATLKNLRDLKFPQAWADHVLLKTPGSRKEDRREIVREKYRIVALVGDNLNDFSDVFENKNVADRFTVTDSLRSEFGSRFIVLPNPGYGDWEGALLEYRYSLPAGEKNRIRKSRLRRE